MKFIRLLLISVFVFALLITAVSLFIPGTVRISRAINIAASQDSVLRAIDDLSKWKRWYPGFDNIALYKSVEKNGKTVAAVAQGIQIKIIVANDTLVTAQLLKGKRPVHLNWLLIKHAGADSATLQTFADFHLKWYPWEKFSSLMLDRSYGTVMEQGLKNLKSNAE